MALEHSPNGPGKRPIMSFEQVTRFELFDVQELSEEERNLVLLALQAQARSTDSVVHAGAAALSEDGRVVAMHNDIEGSGGHAEQRAVSALYAQTEGENKLKAVALAVCLAGDEMVNEQTQYDSETPRERINWSKPCESCRGFLHSVTANSPDAVFLGVTRTGQVVRTKLRDLLPEAYEPFRVQYDPLHGGPVVRHSGKRGRRFQGQQPQVDLSKLDIESHGNGK